MRYIFIFNLETGKVCKENPTTDYCVKYYNTDSGKMVDIGDGYRHEMIIEGKNWNRILKIIKNKELDESGIEAIIGLMKIGLRAEHIDSFVSAIKKGVIKEI